MTGSSMKWGWQAVCVVLGWALLYLSGLGTRELQGEEARRVLPGRTMLQTGDWAVPRSAGKVYNRKPPLINWATALAIKLTGSMTEWVVRLPSVMGMLLLALAVLLAGRLWLGGDGAFLAAVICLTNIGFLEKGRLAEIEALYIACFGVALVIWLALWWNEQRLAAWVLSGVMLGVGFLAKGPLHVWYFYALAGGVLWVEGRLRELLGWRHAVGLAAFVAVWLPWALTNSASNPQKDSGRVWMEQVTHRLGLVEFDWVNWLLQVPQSVVNFLPWALLLPLLWSRSVTSSWTVLGRRGRWLKGLRAGLVVGFLAIALLPSSRPRFMLPLNVAAALLVVECWLLLPVAQQVVWLRRWIGWLLGLVAIAGVGGLLAAWVWRAQVDVEWMVTGPAVLVWAALWLWSWWLSREKLRSVGSEKGNLAHAWALANLALLGAGVLILAVTVAPLTTVTDQLRPFAKEILSHTQGEALVLFKVEERMWPFYLGVNCREVALLEELPQEVKWVMVRERDVAVRRAEMSRRFGPVQQEMVIQEPLTGNAGGKGERYVLFEFGRAP